jgi:hypothetical protein
MELESRLVSSAACGCYRAKPIAQSIDLHFAVLVQRPPKPAWLSLLLSLHASLSLAPRAGACRLPGLS